MEIRPKKFKPWFIPLTPASFVHIYLYFPLRKNALFMNYKDNVPLMTITKYFFSYFLFELSPFIVPKIPQDFEIIFSAIVPPHKSHTTHNSSFLISLSVTPFNLQYPFWFHLYLWDFLFLFWILSFLALETNFFCWPEKPPDAFLCRPFYPFKKSVYGWVSKGNLYKDLGWCLCLFCSLSLCGVAVM